jgi:uncharacterized protein YggE
MKTGLMCVMAAGLAASGVMAGSAVAQPVVPSAPYQTVDLPLLSLNTTGEVEAAPDMATVGTGVQTRALTAKEAVSQTNVKMRKLVDAIAAAGIERKYIQTSAINLSAQYDYSNANNGGVPKFIGYEASNQVTVEVRDLPKLSSVIDQMVQAGATNLNGPTFGIIDREPLMVQAREKAMKQARERAEFYAKASGYRTIRLVSISESGGGYSPLYPMPMARMKLEAADSTVVEPGRLSVNVSLSIQYVMER